MTAAAPSGTTWQQVAAYLTYAFPVEQQWPGQGMVIVLNGMADNHRVLVVLENPGSWGVEHVTIEAPLGKLGEVDVAAAVKAAGSIAMAGVVCREEIVALRVSRCLSTLSLEHLAATVGSVSGALDGYVMIRGHSS